MYLNMFILKLSKSEDLKVHHSYVSYLLIFLVTRKASSLNACALAKQSTQEYVQEYIQNETDSVMRSTALLLESDPSESFM